MSLGYNKTLLFSVECVHFIAFTGREWTDGTEMELGKSLTVKPILIPLLIKFSIHIGLIFPGKRE